jgi:hypothetical protein
VELERATTTIREHGYGLCSISYDSGEILRDFARRRGITFPLLADPDSAIIRRFGLLNEHAQPGSRDEGMAHPGIFLVDQTGVVRQRFFEDHYWNRLTVPAVFWRLGVTMQRPAEMVDDERVRVRTSTSDAAVSPGNRFTLFVDVDPAPAVHVYAPDVCCGYQGLDLSVDPLPYVKAYPARFPAALPLEMAWADEPLTGYTSAVRVAVDVALARRQDLGPVLEAGRGLTMTGTLRLQACDDRVCWPPQSIPLSWHVELLPPDLQRVPEAIQRKARG